MPEQTPQVVFDCNVFVQGIANRNSPARKALRLFFDGAISLFVSEAILREVRDVLSRLEVRHRLPGINDRIVNALLSKLEALQRSSQAVMNVRRGDVLLVDYPYPAETGAKVRPVLVISKRHR